MSAFEVGGTYSTTLSQFEDDLEIRSQAKTSGCYAILSLDKALYVGCSVVDMTTRLLAHANGYKTSPYLHARIERGKRCNERFTITLIPTLPEEARVKEAEIIGELDPLYNSKRPSLVRY